MSTRKIRPWVQCQHCSAVWMLRKKTLSRQCPHCNRRDWRANGAEPRRDIPRGKLGHKFHTCLRCGWVWIARWTWKTGKPLRCPSCMTPYWQEGKGADVRISKVN